LVFGYKDTQNLDERSDLNEKLLEKVLFLDVNGQPTDTSLGGNLSWLSIFVLYCF
jgi:hypothetical protein